MKRSRLVPGLFVRALPRATNARIPLRVTWPNGEREDLSASGLDAVHSRVAEISALHWAEKEWLWAQARASQR